MNLSLLISLSLPAISQIAPVPLAPPPATNIVTRKTFTWDFPMEQMPELATFRFYVGTNSGSYNYTEDTGTNLTFSFVRTNWSEQSFRHYAVVSAVAVDDFESLPSNEVHFPAFAPDHFMICWSSNWSMVNVLESTNALTPRTNWTVRALIMGTNCFSDVLNITDRQRFFCLDKPDVLTITLFNPNP